MEMVKVKQIACGSGYTMCIDGMANKFVSIILVLTGDETPRKWRVMGIWSE